MRFYCERPNEPRRGRRYRSGRAERDVAIGILVRIYHGRYLSSYQYLLAAAVPPERGRNVPAAIAGISVK